MISDPRCFGSPTWGMEMFLGDSGDVDVAPWPGTRCQHCPTSAHMVRGMQGEGSQPSPPETVPV